MQFCTDHCPAFFRFANQTQEMTQAQVLAKFGPLASERIIAAMVPENDASARVLEKQGMVRQEATQAWGMPVVMYRLLREDNN